MDYTTAPDYVTDSQGRRQVADRDLLNGIVGTAAVAADQNGPTNELMCVITKLGGFQGDAADDTLLAQTLLILNKNASATAIGCGSTVTLTAPAWANRAEVLLIGGGGGGSACQAKSSGENVCGGGAGALAWGEFDVSPGEKYAVVIPNGGISESNGGDSTFGPVNGDVMMTAGGGYGSTFTSQGDSAGGVGGVPSGQTIFGCVGAPGSDGQATGEIVKYGSGDGGSGPFGGNGRGASGGGSAANASGPGGGGGGAYDLSLTGAFIGGGFGSSGYGIIKWKP